MPASDDETRIAAGVQIGPSLTLVRGADLRPSIEVLKDGHAYRGDAALTLVFDALKAERVVQEAQR